MCNQDLQIESTVRTYEMLRKQIEHEDELINQRLQWLLTTTTILFAGLGLFDKTNDQIWPVIQFIIPSLGFIISLLCLCAIYSANANLHTLESHWTDMQNFPPIMGKANGFSNAKITFYGIPIAISVAWSVILTCVIAAKIA
jgi:hypothetical protein